MLFPLFLNAATVTCFTGSTPAMISNLRCQPKITTVLLAEQISSLPDKYAFDQRFFGKR